MYFITTKRMLEVCFSVHPNIQYRTLMLKTLLAGDIIVSAEKNYSLVTGNLID